MTDIKSMIILSKQLKLLCKKKDITISQLSRATKIPLPTLNHIVNGRPPRKLEHIKTLCSYFSCSADYLLFGEEPVIHPASLPEHMQSIGQFEVYLKKILR